MASEESRQGEELNSSMDTSTDDAGANEDAREARRLRREQKKEEEDDPSLLDVTDDEEERGLPTTRARAQREEDTEAATEAITAGPAMAPPPPNSYQRRIVWSYTALTILLSWLGQRRGGICPSGSSHQETTTSKATLSWRARKGSTCISKTARQYSNCWEWTLIVT
jgi:hypothetical protein